MPTLVDANVILDIATSDPVWREWSETSLSDLIDERSTLIVNPIIYAEVSVGFSSPDVLERVLSRIGVEREPLPWDAAFLAGKAFLAYRRKGGERRSPLPDFFIGAHAAVRGYPLITRDPKPYRTYFPNLQVIAPDRL
ncbi:type II toxin-antitoxin system VapC family toxin [soil metagenome]